MPSIASRAYTPAQGVVLPTWPTTPPSWGKPVSTPEAPGISPTLRCPMPILTTPSPDNLRQYYAGGSIPQYRINTPFPITGTAIQSTSSSAVTTSFSGMLTTTAKTSDTVAVAGATRNSFVSVSPTNFLAASMTGVYALVLASGQVVVYHPATAGGTFKILVQSNN